MRCHAAQRRRRCTRSSQGRTRSYYWYRCRLQQIEFVRQIQDSRRNWIRFAHRDSQHFSQARLSALTGRSSDLAHCCSRKRNRRIRTLLHMQFSYCTVYSTCTGPLSRNSSPKKGRVEQARESMARPSSRLPLNSPTHFSALAPLRRDVSRERVVCVYADRSKSCTAEETLLVL